MLKKSFSKTKPVCKVTFTLPLEAAQGGKEVRILGDFNEWSWENGYKMKVNKTEFATEIELEAGKEYQFRYLIDNHIWENDWNADNYIAAPFGVYNSVISLVETKTNGTAKKEAAKKEAPKAAAAKAATDKAAPAAKSEAKPAATKAAKPAAKKAATTTADDLTKIEGIGPKIAELLKAEGIATFANLADAKVATLKAILEKAGKRYQMHDPATWTEQAKVAAKADWAKLEKMQAELKGGKR